MSARDERIAAEARDLWAATHEGAPPASLDGGELIDRILSDCGEVDYERLHSPHLRPGMVMGGGRRRA